VPKSKWHILGIKKTTDVAEIKRAYAAKLKVTRPDTDPEGFQALREARDQAEQWARYQWEDEDDVQNKPIDDNTTEAELSIFEPLTVFDKVQPEDKQDEQDKKDDEDDNDKKAEPSPEDTLAHWLTGITTAPDALEVHYTFNRIRDLSFEDRGIAEANLLYAIMENFAQRQGKFDEDVKHHQVASDDFANKTILKICDEFGWFNNDRRLEELLYGDATQIADQLRSLKEFGTIKKDSNYGYETATPPWRLPGLWVWLAFMVVYLVLRALK
jgi:hypothetical protein